MKKPIVALGLLAFVAIFFVIGCPDSSIIADSGTAAVSLAAQSGTITGGTAGSATFAATTANIADGTEGTIGWYTSADGTATTASPAGITQNVTNVSGNASTITMMATSAAVAGSYYFKSTFSSTISSVATLTVTVSTTQAVSLAAQVGTILFEYPGEASFAAATANVADGSEGEIAWYASTDGTATTGDPAGITPSVANVLDNASTITMTTTSAAAAGSYYFKATFGTATSSVATLLIKAPYSIGDTGPAGGIIFYDKGSITEGWRYLEAAPSDQSAGMQWRNASDTETWAEATAIGTGAANTTTIVNQQGVGTYAAKLCADLTLGGYSDWFLPSKDELHQMFVNLKEKSRGGFSDGTAWYWSSSEQDSDYAWGEGFGIGSQTGCQKDVTLHVRAARAF